MFSITPILADVVWPALVVVQRLFGIIPITVGLIVEWLVLRFGGFGLSWKKAAVVDVAMNAASTAIGIFLIPALGFVWEFFPGLLLFKVFNMGTFNPVTWAFTFLMAVFVTTLVEACVVRWGFKIAMSKRRFWTLWGANAVSVAIAFTSLWVRPPKL